MEVQYEQAIRGWLGSCYETMSVKAHYETKEVLVEDMWEKGRKIEFPWLFNKSGAQNIHIVTANWMWANFDETSVPNTLLN